MGVAHRGQFACIFIRYGEPRCMVTTTLIIPTKLRGTLKEVWVRKGLRSVLLSGNHINRPHPETQRDCTRDMGIHAQSNRHQTKPRALSWATSDDGLCVFRRSSTAFRRSDISLSNCSAWSQ